MAARFISAAGSLSKRGQNSGTTHILGLGVGWTTSFWLQSPPPTHCPHQPLAVS